MICSSLTSLTSQAQAKNPAAGNDAHVDVAFPFVAVEALADDAVMSRLSKAGIGPIYAAMSSLARVFESL